MAKKGEKRGDVTVRSGRLLPDPLFPDQAADIDPDNQFLLALPFLSDLFLDDPEDK